MITTYSPQNIYTRDVNTANNKSDQFITKQVQVLDEEGNVLLNAQTDIVDLTQIGGLQKGKTYQLQIAYDFGVEERYKGFIRELEKKYKIKLTPREEHILVLKPILYEGEDELRRWATRGMIYFPPQVQILKVEGDVKAFGEFYPEFAKGVRYRMSTDKNFDSLEMKIVFTG